MHVVMVTCFILIFYLKKTSGLLPIVYTFNNIQILVLVFILFSEFRVLF